MTTWFTSDTHFGHANIMGYCDRPWDDVHVMDRALIENWAIAVSPDDVIYHLGDFCWGGPTRMEEILRWLPGHKHLIVGNHDPSETRCRRVLGWESVHKHLEIELDGVLVVLNHYPLEEWNMDLAGSYHLHGHCHGTRPQAEKNPRRLDVGVDPSNYWPLTWEEIHARLDMRAVPLPPPEPYKARP